MKVDKIQVNNFRSVQSAELNDCGDLNVLIGKNNSGKSNMLIAVDAFFRCINRTSVIALNPPIGKEVDFFGKSTSLPMSITLTLRLSNTELDKLISDIIEEAPQVKNALTGAQALQYLSVTVSLFPPRNRFAYVSKIIMSNGTEPYKEETLLRIDADAALELYRQISRADQLTRDANELRGLDGERLRYVFRDRPDITFSASRTSGTYSLLGTLTAGMSSKTRQTAERIINETTSYTTAITEINNLAARLDEEAIQIEDAALENKIDSFAGQESYVPRYIKNLLANIANLHVLYLTERRKEIGREEATRLLELKVTRGGPETLRNIQETVAALLGVQIDAFRGVSPQEKGEAPAELDVDNFLVEVNGAGIREALRVILDHELVRPQIMLVEEPEIHLHPALEISMMRYLKRISSECQVFITTHSTNFLDMAAMKNVYLVSKSDSTQILHLDLEQAEAQIPKELGIRLSSLFMFDRLVFVEGPSDEAVLREWASKIGVNLGQANVGFVHMGGARNFAHYATEEIMSFLAKRQVSMWFILDRDERDDQEIAKLKNLLGDRAKVVVLRKRELENYLICARAIAEAIGEKSRISGRPQKAAPTVSDVQSKVEECAEELKQLTIDKRVAKLLCRPVYPSWNRIFEASSQQPIQESIDEEIADMLRQLETARAMLSQTYEEQAQAIDEAWSSKKLDLILGDHLLEKVYQFYGFRFKKDRDGIDLAMLMNENEIDQEVRSLIIDFGAAP
jgi:putative ATP-dependent endonuclease of OLD family